MAGRARVREDRIMWIWSGGSGQPGVSGWRAQVDLRPIGALDFPPPDGGRRGVGIPLLSLVLDVVAKNG